MESSPSRPVAISVPSVKPPCYVFATASILARHVAQLIANVIRERNALGQQAVLALPTGSTPIDVFRELIRMHREEGLDFSRVITFNVSEYYGLPDHQPQSCRVWMEEHFFSQINIRPENTHLPDGAASPEEVAELCHRYEQKIAEAGGLDVALLGLGRNGHIGFNEPFSVRKSRTRLCTLDPVTRRSAAGDFFGEDHVPTQAITMGVGTLLDARKVLLLAMGEHKAQIVSEVLQGPVTDRVPASFLQAHNDATVLVDSSAAKRLTGYATPWLTGNIEWNEYSIKRAVLWLCDQTEKALLMLDDEDFRNHNLHQLLRHHGPAQTLAQDVFQWMMKTIEHHPAGREPKKVICFSPHPDDDVISMGGTLIRLVEDGHEAHIAYMTSGNIAVFDHDALRIADMVTEYNRLFGIDEERSQDVERQVAEALNRKSPGESDTECVAKIKSLIRWSEAKAGAFVVGCREEHLHYLDLPFYRTGTVAKKPIGDEDVEIIYQLLEQVGPDQVYVAGDLADPHGTHRMCAIAIFHALRRYEQAHGARPDVLLYRGAWQEYELHELEIAVPLSPRDLDVKRKAIFMHESQKDEALFPGSDPREFWQRAEDRNRGTASRFNQIGLPEFFAIEAFVRWDGNLV
ncbi:MAG: glucosamine-6-phosphate deaminase [Planctomycetales bacterium]|nr:glucosamine-6-phosphate deaminase [Planctomycetales bacterium]